MNVNSSYITTLRCDHWTLNNWTDASWWWRCCWRCWRDSSIVQLHCTVARLTDTHRLHYMQPMNFRLVVTAPTHVQYTCHDVNWTDHRHAHAGIDVADIVNTTARLLWLYTCHNTMEVPDHQLLWQRLDFFMKDMDLGNYLKCCHGTIGISLSLSLSSF